MISIIWRVVVVLAGAAVVGAATHANVQHAGGYGSEDSYIILAVAVLLAVGMGYAAIAWREGRYLGALALGLCLLCGEGYWLATNAERELASRDAAAEPARLAADKYAAAQRRVKDAETAKKAADDAAITEAAKPGCKQNCATLLLDAKRTAETELKDARNALAFLPAPHTSTPLPERLGLEPWAWDLLMAGLRSLAVVGGSIAIALALHPPRSISASASPTQAPAPQVREPLPMRESYAPTRADLRQIEPPKPDSREHVAQFLRAVLKPDPEGVTSLRKLHGHYLEWCKARTIEPLPAPELGKQLRTIVDAIGLDVVPEGQDAIVKGAALAA